MIKIVIYYSLFLLFHFRNKYAENRVEFTSKTKPNLIATQANDVKGFFMAFLFTLTKLNTIIWIWTSKVQKFKIIILQELKYLMQAFF